MTDTQLKLRPMSEVEYKPWLANSQKSYALEKMKANGLTREEAEKISRESFERLLPEGLKTKDQYLFTAVNGENQNVGVVWFAAQGPSNNRKAFVFDILIDEKYQGKGYGRATMLAAEAEATKLGLKRIGLHVFGHNERAINLYKSLNYEVTDLVMEKGL